MTVQVGGSFVLHCTFTRVGEKAGSHANEVDVIWRQACKTAACLRRVIDFDYDADKELGSELTLLKGRSATQRNEPRRESSP